MDRTSEVLFSSENQNELGIIVYKKALSNEFSGIGFSNTFEIKTLFVIDPLKNSGKKNASKLLKHIAKKAVDQDAKSIFVTVSSAKPETLAFFLAHGFRIAEKRKSLYVEGLDEYFLFNPSPQKLLNTITFELLAKHRIRTTPLCKTHSDAFSPTTVQKVILSSFLSGNSSSRTIKNVQNHFGVQVETTDIQDAIDDFEHANLKWQSPELSSEYSIVFINPFFAQKGDSNEVGYLLVGISPLGKRHILGCCPTKSSKCYWLSMFHRLKQQGVHKIHIICGPDEVALPSTLNRLFRSVRINYSKALKKWYPEHLSPKSLNQELINEMKLIKDLSVEEPAQSLVAFC